MEILMKYEKTKKKKKKCERDYLKSWAGIFHVGIIWVEIFRERIYQGEVWLVGIFLGVFLTPRCMFEYK